MHRDGLAEDLRRPVPRVVVLEGADAGEDGAKGTQPDGGIARILVIAPAHREPDPVATRHHDAGRLDLHVQLVHLSRPERLLVVMTVVRAVS